MYERQNGLADHKHRRKTSQQRQERFYRVVEQETERESLSKSQERKRKDIRLGIEKDMVLDQLRYLPKKNLNWLNMNRICIKHY